MPVKTFLVSGLILKAVLNLLYAGDDVVFDKHQQ